ncbi:MAG: MBL fold metallo-hydrolase [Candidatus Saccharimonadales bacterium]
MELQYFGANGLKFTTKKSVLVIDPVSDITNSKVDIKKATTVMVTQVAFKPLDAGETFVIDGPGEYEFEEYAIKGIPAQAHTAPSGDKSATMYWINIQDITFLVTGHIDPKLSEEQLEAIGIVDVVVIPVGGNGYTLDATAAVSVVRAVEPKLVIPVHSSDDGLSYEVAQDAVGLFTKELGAPVAEEVSEKLKFKTMSEQLTVQLLKKS